MGEVDGKRKIRRVSRAKSRDYLSWSAWQQMEYRHNGELAPAEQIYTNQTQPYFRAPHIYLAVGARFMQGRNVLTREEAQSLGLNPGYFRDSSDAVLMSSRGGNYYDRTFMESFIRPGIGLGNWASRSNYPALNVVQTGPSEMSLYVAKEYAQPTIHLRRYSLRLDGFVSVRAAYSEGELITKPLKFQGKELEINFSSSAAGGLRIEIQDAAGKPIPGYSLSECREVIGDEIERVVKWKQGTDISHLADKPVRLRFVMKDTDLYSFRVRP